MGGPGREPRRAPGLRYETCAGCGREWNVSRCARLGWYICPDCRAKERRERRRRDADADA